MSDIFNPEEARKRIGETFEATERARKETSDILTRSQEQIRAANDAQARNIQIFSGRAETNFDRMETALDNLSDAEALPDSIANFLGLFDSDFNKDKQLSDLRKAEFELGRINQQQQNANTSAQLTASTAAAEAESAIQQFTFTRQGFLDTAAAAELGFTIEEGIRQRDLDLVQNLSTEDLRKFAADPSKAPANLRDKPGLIQSVLINKMSAELGIQAQQLNVEVNRDVLEQRRRENLMRKFPTPQLQNMMETGSFPGDLDLGTVQDEVNRRTAVEQDLRASSIANQQGELQLAEASKIRALQQMTIQELQTGLAEASQNNGRMNFQGVDLTATELRSVLLQKQAVEREQRDLTLSNIAAQAQTEGTIAEIGTLSKGLTGATNPGTPFNPNNPAESLPPQIQSKVLGLQAQLEAMTKLQEAGVDTVNKQVEILTEMRNEINGFKESFIESQPSDTQNGYRQFIDNSGFIEDNKAAADFLSASSSPFALNYDPIMARPFEAFANSINDLASQQVKSIGTAEISAEGDAGATGTLQIREQKELDPQQLIQQALKESGAGNTLTQMLTQKLLADTIVDLQGGNNQSIWGGIVDPQTRTFDERVFSPEGKFEFKRLAQLVAAKDVAFREAGITQPGNSMISVLVDRARTLSPSLREIGTNDPTAAAFVKSAYNNNPQLSVNSLLMRFKDQDQPALAAVLEQKQLLEEQGKAVARSAAIAEGNTEKSVLESMLSGMSRLSPSPSQVRQDFGLNQPAKPSEFELHIRNVLNEPQAGRGGTP